MLLIRLSSWPQVHICFAVDCLVEESCCYKLAVNQAVKLASGTLTICFAVDHLVVDSWGHKHAAEQAVQLASGTILIVNFSSVPVKNSLKS